MMNNHADSNQSARSLASIVAELKHEVKDFVDTRVVMFKSELREKLSHWKLAAPLAGLGVLLVATAYVLITLSLVALVAAFIHSEYRWFFGFLSVGVLWGILGGVAAYIAKREFEMSKVMPRQTLEVLKGDKVWIQQEVRNQA